LSSIRIITSRQHLLRSLADIVATLAKTERGGTLRERIRFFCVFALLIVAEIGYLPVTLLAAAISSSTRQYSI
jgi:hypothetical protein